MVRVDRDHPPVEIRIRNQLAVRIIEVASDEGLVRFSNAVDIDLHTIGAERDPARHGARGRRFGHARLRPAVVRYGQRDRIRSATSVDVHRVPVRPRIPVPERPAPAHDRPVRIIAQVHEVALPLDAVHAEVGHRRLVGPATTASHRDALDHLVREPSIVSHPELDCICARGRECVGRVPGARVHHPIPVEVPLPADDLSSVGITASVHELAAQIHARDQEVRNRIRIVASAAVRGHGHGARKGIAASVLERHRQTGPIHPRTRIGVGRRVQIGRVDIAVSIKVPLPAGARRIRHRALVREYARELGADDRKVGLQDVVAHRLVESGRRHRPKVVGHREGDRIRATAWIRIRGVLHGRIRCPIPVEVPCPGHDRPIRVGIGAQIDERALPRTARDAELRRGRRVHQDRLRHRIRKAPDVRHN